MSKFRETEEQVTETTASNNPSFMKLISTAYAELFRDVVAVARAHWRILIFGIVIPLAAAYVVFVLPQEVENHSTRNNCVTITGLNESAAWTDHGVYHLADTITVTEFNTSGLYGSVPMTFTITSLQFTDSVLQLQNSQPDHWIITSSWSPWSLFDRPNDAYNARTIIGVEFLPRGVACPIG